MELDFKKALYDDFGIEFHNLLPLQIYPSVDLDYLIASENYEDYMYALVEAFNPKAVDNVMCKNTLSVGWDGNLYDCDFNQMLNLKLKEPVAHIKDFDENVLKNERFKFHNIAMAVLLVQEVVVRALWCNKKRKSV